MPVPTSPNQHRAVFLDRDGVINQPVVRNGKPFPPASSEELQILPGVSNALKSLSAAGYALIVVTNQPDVARGISSLESVHDIHASLKATLALDEFFVCFHDDDDKCRCRKPQPGLLLQAAREFNIDLSSSYMVGDRWRDIEAGHQAGCTTFFVDYGYDEPRPNAPFYTVSSLLEASTIILG